MKRLRGEASNLGKVDPAALHCVRKLPGRSDKQIHIHKSSVRERRHVNSTFLPRHSSEAPGLIIRQPYKSRGSAGCSGPSPVYTWLMAEN